MGLPLAEPTSAMMRYLALFSTLLLVSSLAHAVPRVIQHQGRVLVSGVNFTGTAGFKFALVSSDGATTFWSNDGTSTAGSEPTGAVPLTVTNGSYAVGLGDTTLPNMQVVPPSVFIANNDVRLRVWFNDGSHGWQLLTPDQRLAAVAWALSAREAETVADGSVTSAKIANGAVTTSALASGAVTSAKIANGSVNGSALAPGAAVANLNASGYGAVATGGIVFGHSAAEAGLTANGFVMQSSFSVGQTWTGIRVTGAPVGRSSAVSVWTGTEWIVWGGLLADGTTRTNTGARYNPATNTWTTMSTTNAPAARSGHAAVWTGSEMWVFGGRVGGSPGSLTNTGGIYNPTTDTWTVLPATNAPTAREGHTATWFGTGMLVFGGTDAGGITGTSSRLNALATAWITLPVSPQRKSHTAVHSGNYVLIWGGEDSAVSAMGTGVKFDSRFDTLTLISMTNAPAARRDHCAVLINDRVLIWGGVDATGAPLDSGAFFDLGSFNWTTLGTTGGPSARSRASAAWTGSQILIWGGMDGSGAALNDGSIYTPATLSWTPMTNLAVPSTRWSALSAWTGTEFLVWGGSTAGGVRDTGARFNPSTTLWMYVRQ